MFGDMLLLHKHGMGVEGKIRYGHFGTAIVTFSRSERLFVCCFFSFYWCVWAGAPFLFIHFCYWGNCILKFRPGQLVLWVCK